LDPVTVVHRKRDREGNVIAEKSLDTPRPHWIVEKLAFFNERIAAARALRDTTLSRREAILNHRELLGAYWALDTGQKVAEEKIKSPEGRARFMSLLRETLATTIERGEPLPRPACVTWWRARQNTCRTGSRRADQVPHTRMSPHSVGPKTNRGMRTWAALPTRCGVHAPARRRLPLSFAQEGRVTARAIHGS
jgi:hypothetical protein